MSKQQLITIVTLQLIAVLSVGWFLVAEHSSNNASPETPPDSMIPATPAMAPPIEWAPEEDEYVEGSEEMSAFELYYEDESAVTQ